MFLGVGTTGSVAFGRPKRSQVKRNFLFGAAVMFLVGLGIWYYVFSFGHLAKRLAPDTLFYATVSIPETNPIKRAIFFWNKSSSPNKEAARLYQKFNLISWNNVSFAEQVLPMLKYRVEMAEFGDNYFVISAELKDRKQWLDLAGYASESYNSEAISLGKDFSGFALSFAPPGKEWFWRLDGNQLYIVSSLDALDLLYQKNKSHFTDLIPRYRTWKSLAYVYIKDSSALNIKESFYPMISPKISYPIHIQFTDSGNFLSWEVKTAENIGSSEADEDANSGYSIPTSYASDSLYPIFFKNLSKSFIEWEDIFTSNEYRIDNNIGKLRSYLDNFYNSDLSLLLEEIKDKSGALYVMPQKDNRSAAGEWMLVFDSNNDNKLEDLLRRFATTLFAISHPVESDIVLADNTIMSELRIDTEGLDWEELEWQNNGRVFAVQALRGNGEVSGYFLAKIPDVGLVLASSLDLLDGYLTKMSVPENLATNFSGCKAYTNSELSGFFSSEFLFDDDFVQSVVGQVIVGSMGNQGARGCIMFKN